MNPALMNMMLGLVGAFFTFAFGGWSQLLILLCIAMAIDYITGVAAVIRTGSKLNSKIGFWGLTRKGLMLLVILLAHQIDLLIGTDVVKGGAMYFYLANELISITENYSRIGLPLPAKLKEIIELVKKQAEDDEAAASKRKMDDEKKELTEQDTTPEDAPQDIDETAGELRPRKDSRNEISKKSKGPKK